MMSLQKIKSIIESMLKVEKDNSKVAKFVAKEEGFESKPYEDTLGVLTFGHGLTYITKEESLYIMKSRLSALDAKLETKYKWYGELTDRRKLVIMSMCYQLGLSGFSKFKKTIKLIREDKFKEAGDEMRVSRAYKQTKNRWDRQIAIFKKG